MNRPTKGLRFNLERRNFGRQIDVQMFVPRDDGSTDVATLVTFQHVKIHEAVEDVGSVPLTLGERQAQELMDELWRCGLRPSEGTGSAGSLAATERHLKDMQRIAMGLLRLEGDDLSADDLLVKRGLENLR